MSEIVVDATFRDKLIAAAGGAEFRDEQGRMLGRFVPEFDPTLFHVPEIGLSPEELARRLGPDAKTYTTEEFMAYLRSRT